MSRVASSRSPSLEEGTDSKQTLAACSAPDNRRRIDMKEPKVRVTWQKEEKFNRGGDLEVGL